MHRLLANENIWKLDFLRICVFSDSWEFLGILSDLVAQKHYTRCALSCKTFQAFLSRYRRILWKGNVNLSWVAVTEIHMLACRHLSKPGESFFEIPPTRAKLFYQFFAQSTHGLGGVYILCILYISCMFRDLWYVVHGTTVAALCLFNLTLCQNQNISNSFISLFQKSSIYFSKTKQLLLVAETLYCYCFLNKTRCNKNHLIFSEGNLESIPPTNLIDSIPWSCEDPNRRKKSTNCTCVFWSCTETEVSRYITSPMIILDFWLILTSWNFARKEREKKKEAAEHWPFLYVDTCTKKFDRLFSCSWYAPFPSFFIKEIHGKIKLISNFYYGCRVWHPRPVDTMRSITRRFLVLATG